MKIATIIGGTGRNDRVWTDEFIAEMNTRGELTIFEGTGPLDAEASAAPPPTGSSSTRRSPVPTSATAAPSTICAAASRTSPSSSSKRARRRCPSADVAATVTVR